MHRNDFEKKEESFNLKRYNYITEKEKLICYLEIFPVNL